MIVKNIVNRQDRIYGYNNKKLYITIHETGNTNAGADAVAHGKLQARGNPRKASWHYTVDDQRVVQSFPHEAQCWHAGTGRLGDGNMNSIAIEICVNSDGDYTQAVKNAAALTRKIADEEGIAYTDIVQHNKWSLKNCPQRMRANGQAGWNVFMALVKGSPVIKPPAPAPAPKPKPNETEIDLTKLPVIRPGDKGVYVGIMQGALIARGYNVGKHGVDNSNGPATQRAIVAYQKQHPTTGGANGKPDGICGPRMWKHLLGA